MGLIHQIYASKLWAPYSSNLENPKGSGKDEYSHNGKNEDPHSGTQGAYPCFASQNLATIG
jgi:hypothetical protein